MKKKILITCASLGLILSLFLFNHERNFIYIENKNNKEECSLVEKKEVVKEEPIENLNKEVLKDITKEEPKEVKQEVKKDIKQEDKKENKEENPYPYVESKIKSGLFYLEIPKINVHNFWVQRGTGDEQSQLNVGGSLLQDSPMPTVNTASKENTVVGAHRFWTNSWNPFRNIDKLDTGDEIFVILNGNKICYQVYDQFVAHAANDYDKVVGQSNNKIITLYSCESQMGEDYRRVIKAKYKG